MDWREEMEERRKAAETNQCRELVEVSAGSEWMLRRMMVNHPEYVWKYAEGVSVPGYALSIAQEFGGDEDVPSDKFPCEYFRVMEHSMPTELALQPKRFDKAREQLTVKLQRFYERNESRFCIPESQLIPRMACVARVNDIWYRAKLENAPVAGQWLYVFLVDYGASRQVLRQEVRLLAAKFGHYPPMVVRAVVSGAFIQRMDINKVERFRDLMASLDYTVRCQIVSSSEPYKVNVCHPTNDDLNICHFLLAPARGMPAEDGLWPPKQLAIRLNAENGVVVEDPLDDSGADSDFDEYDDVDGWLFSDQNEFMRSYPVPTKVFRCEENLFQVEKIENECLIYLTTEAMRRNRAVSERCLHEARNTLEVLPPIWLVYGTACVVDDDDGVLRRGAIVGINGSQLDVLLVDYGVTMKSCDSQVFSLPNVDALNREPQVTLVGLSDYSSAHFSRVRILRRLVPRGTTVLFHVTGRSRSIPTKGSLVLPNGAVIERFINDELFIRNIDTDCVAVVPFRNHFPNLARSNRVINFVYHCQSLTVYRKSRCVTSQF